MKRVLIFFLSLLLAFSLVACKSESSTSKATVSNNPSLSNLDLLQEFDKFKNKIDNISSISKKEKEIDKLIKRIGVGNFPLIQDNNIIFLYRAESKEKDIAFISDLSNWKKIKLEQLADTSLYYLHLKAPAGSRFDYKFMVDRELKNDPLNNNTIINGVFGLNSQVIMPKYHSQGYWKGDLEIKKGHLNKKIIGEIEVSIYLPADYEENPSKGYPVLYFLGGDKYLKYGDITNTLDKMTAKNKIDQVIGVFIDSKDLSSEDEITSHLIKRIIAYVDGEYSTLADANKRVLIGYDIFAELALDTILDDNGIVTSYLGQSPLLSEQSIKLLTDNPQENIRFYLHWGKFANEQQQINNFKMIKRLKEAGYQYKAEINLDGNDWGNWRENIAQGLEYILSDKHSANGVDSLAIKEDFAGQYPNYFEIENNESIVTEQGDGSYQITFKDSSFVKLSHYQFSSFNFESKLELLSDAPFALVFSGEQKYTLMIDSQQRLITIFGDGGEELYHKGIGDLIPMKSIKLIAKDNKLNIYLNNKGIAKVDFSTETGKYLSILGIKGTKVRLNNLSIEEEF
ncbi:enterochelin esterase-like enzyme [Orenia metallireducens]|uniref:Enterochelin esterase n=1 Tax=Orenia metallireducens TaxID=1413210 RepID=A0A285IB61_9FIRM|nr:alpha/beta hydrolase-fold protein [Orenia metallireducens]PRX20617.1 enterochelin esterase-like enzyme [Orenia metallireducens]SNY45190.1 Enterochelin esterase [Orenia metallireducens]